MGYRGKVKEQEAPRRLRAQNFTIIQIADQLGVSKSSVSLWVRDVPITPSKRRYGPQARWHPWKEGRLREIAEVHRIGAERIGVLSDEAFFAAGVALYAGEGAKTDGKIRFANTDQGMVAFFCASTRWAVCTSTTRPHVYTGRSWVWSMLCYRQKQFRGSSIGRTLDC